MSRENVVLFTKQINKDRTLAELVQKAPATVEAWAQIAYDAGFEFTASEFRSVVEQALGRSLKSDNAVREYLDAQTEMGAGELGQHIMDAIGGGFMASSEESAKKWSQLVAKAWTDEKLKKRLMDEPATVLREHGIEVPAGMDIRVVENTDKIAYLPLPPKPTGNVDQLNSEQLDSVAGGWSWICGGCVPKYIVFEPLFSERIPAPTYKIV